jgi:hypothetical protein
MLVGTAAISDGRTMDHADVLYSLCKAGGVKNSLADNKSDIGKIEGW